MDLRLNMDEYLPLREVVFKTLRNAIVHGEFEPGERLMEVTLAKRLGVSRTPVREAMRMLELEGLVVMIPRRGAEVARITAKDLSDRACLQKDRRRGKRAVEAVLCRLQESGKLQDNPGDSRCGCCISQYYNGHDEQSETDQHVPESS